MRKTDENYSLGQPRIDFINPPIIDNSLDFVQYTAVVGLNLFMNINEPSQTSIILKRVKDVDGIALVNPEVFVLNNIQVYQSNFQLFTFGINWKNYQSGYYKVFATHNSLTNLTSPEIFVNQGINQVDANIVSSTVVDKFPFPSDVVNTEYIYHKNITSSTPSTLEKAVKTDVLFNYSTGFVVEFSYTHYNILYSACRLVAGLSNRNENIDLGFIPEVNMGNTGNYGMQFQISSSSYSSFLGTQNTNFTVKCIIINKNGITTSVMITPFGVLVGSSAQIYNVGDPIRLYVNFFGTYTGGGFLTGSEFNLFIPKKYTII